MGRNFINERNISYSRENENGDSARLLDVRFFGDWEKTIKILQKIDPAVKEAGIKSQMKVGNEIIKKVRSHLRNQDLPWPALTKKYAKAKSKASRDSRTLISYGTYYHSLKVWQKSNFHILNIGVPRGIYTRQLDGKKGKIEVAKIAAIHEFGGGKVPKRALWNPTIKEMGSGTGLKKMFVKEFVAQLKRRGIPVYQSWIKL